MKQLREWRSEIPFFRLGHIWDNWCGAIGTWDPTVALPSKETSMRLDKASQHVITRWRHPRASMCTSRLVCSFIFVATIATTINAILIHPILSELTIDNLLPPNTLNRIHMPQITKIHTITNIIAMSPSQTKAQRNSNKIITTTWWQLKVQKCGWYPRVRDKGCAWRLLLASFPRWRFVILYFVFS